MNNDTIDIDGDCDWNNLDFHFLDQKLFGEIHQAIDNKKKLFIDELNKKLHGKWYAEQTQNSLKRDDTITFSRNKISDCYWEFGNNYSLTGSYNKALNYKNLKSYKVQQNDVFNLTNFVVHWGNEKYSNNVSFILVAITDNELKLKFLWY